MKTVRTTAVPRLLVGGAALFAACGAPELPEWEGEAPVRWRPLLEARGDAGGFVRVDPAAAGIDFANVFSEASLLDNDILANGSGVAMGDFDGDGWVDLYVTAVEAENRLYRNLGGWSFEDVTGAAGVGLPESVSRAAAWADMDGDGDLDLLVTRHAEPNVLFRNDGDGAFTDVSEAYGFEAALASHSLTLADTDSDGDLDLYVTNYKDRWVRDTFAPADRAYDRVVGEGADGPFIRPEFTDYFRLVENDLGLQRWEFGQPDEFYLNEGGSFTRVSFTGGTFLDESGAPLDVEPDEWGLSARFADWDLDGDADLYVCNDINSPDHIWVNDGAGRFQLIDPLAVRKTSTASMAVDVADVDRDGVPDLFVAEMLSPDPVERKAQVPEAALNPPEPGDLLNRPQVKRNTLLMGRRDGSFSEVAYQAGVAASGWTWGAVFLDVDLDGYEDLLTTNGTILDWLDGDAQERTQGTQGGDTWRRLRLQFPPLETANLAFRNNGDGTFAVAPEWGFGEETDFSHGVAVGDLDADGDLDVFVNRLDAPPLLFRNDATAPRVAVRLVGDGTNTRAIGARVRYETRGLPAQSTEIAAGGLYLSDADDQVAFAAGPDGAGTVEVVWPDGGRTRVEVVAGRVYEIAPHALEAPTEETRSDPLFEDVSEQAAHTHYDTFWQEFDRQPLLPSRLAQLGPGASWIDSDRDGRPELWVGSGRSGDVTRIRYDGARLRREAVVRAESDIGAIVPNPLAPTGVLAAQSNYESVDPQVGIRQPSVVGVSAGRVSPAIPGFPSTTGPLALADYDGDGDLDLFVGGRVIPSAYPIGASSRFFLNEGGRWVPDELNAGLGEGPLVSGAVFSDLDQDGDPDLVIATEWGPVRIWRNDAGRFRDDTDAVGLAGVTGRWHGVATGDLNEDGRPDIVATSWGANTETQLDGAGLAILHGDVDRNGLYDVIELETHGDGTRAPVRRLDQLGRGLPRLRTIVNGHRDYAALPVEALLPGGPASAQLNEATESRHLVFLSRDGGYDVAPLAPRAQRSPAFGVAVADLNGDGHLDVALAQNFFATKLEVPRHDAGRGLLLLGDGTGALEPQGATESGIRAYGDGRGLAVADYDGDRRLDLAIAQNAGPTRVFRNRAGSPGLRVTLGGPAGNPDAVGASVWLVYENDRGPVVEVQSGGGYWSHNERALTLGSAEGAIAVHVRWPGGAETRTLLEPGTDEIEIRPDGVAP